ncbi:ketose-bisphosphate aldolase [uncultured Robinsoniella sp.]|uniref:class II fructose-bisphosphate aldolase n=1 Tax=uncultured Robinsoniella sp. TaxID=904190 RepID=UPI00374F41F1
MSLVPFKEMLTDAKKHHYAIPAFNVVNMETIQAITQAAQEEGSPLIIQLYHADLDFAGADFMVQIAKTASTHCTIPISVSLDHGQSYEQAVYCIRQGFSGVMIDLSRDDFDANVADTRRVTAYAHARNVSVEAELGTISDASAPLEIRNSGMTDPAKAAEFVARTGVDALAVSIGTAHGIYSSTPVIDFERTKQIVQNIECPVVVHGASGTPDEDIKELCRLGVTKINVGTDLNLGFNKGILEGFQKYGDAAAIREYMNAGREELVKTARHKIKLFRTFYR